MKKNGFVAEVTFNKNTRFANGVGKQLVKVYNKETRIISIDVVQMSLQKQLPGGLSLHFIEKETLAQVFSCEFCEVFTNSFLIEHLPWLLPSLLQTSNEFSIVAIGLFLISFPICFSPFSSSFFVTPSLVVAVQHCLD